jgi:DNA-binding SARP family transcriptional activator
MERTHRHGPNGRHRCSLRIGELEGVVDYDRGEFLKGFSLEDSLLFSDWVLLRQQRLHGYILRALYDLSAFHMAGGNLSRALDFANRQLELEPWREEAHRQVMSILASGGERTSALNQYEICRDLLE